MLNTIILYCKNATPEGNSLSIIKDIASLLLPIIAVVIASWFAYKYALAKMYKETHVLLQRELYTRRLEAYQTLWQLLAFTTATENKKTVLSFVRSTNKADTWFFGKTNAKEFIDTLAEIFYAKGFGVFVNNGQIKANLFEYRSILYGFLLKEKNNTNDLIELQNMQMKERMLQIHETLVQLLQNEIESYSLTENKK